MTLLLVIIGTTIANFVFSWGELSFSYVLASVYICAASGLVFLYIKIIYVMKHFHWYEYERTKKAHRGFLIGSIISLAIQLIFFIYFYVFDNVFNLQKLPRCLERSEGFLIM
jgi:hypothetical protein